ncbi:hypothetical protein JANAI62_23330 [Jannaschia pagri]|uniref:SPOR domain-containing protein n=1 Tax=Jannaschia pagri TaxID=2829797 RepID=A0ABQ4NMT5_9RHOB|nr:SPOR domain-containing protein [Jannaschia sp. AI_61]GIT91876.1 hypothetical protein JANAI61_23340 [Jannaschia sp. AI_61]GIT95710.1 hypothetical protein JANAI62_23330 [Jannaschia sp. AI_62]
MRQANQWVGAPKVTVRFLGTVAAVAVLAGCQATTGGGGDATRASSVSSSSVQLIERDIEAPEVFQANDRALWDGRPSLGGVWVAAPGVKDPERVIIRNESNGKFVIGALFKRERSNPGPSLQLSSDAAAALGIIAGAPTTIDVVALRREEVPDPTAAPQVTAPEAVADAPSGVAEDQIIQAAVPDPAVEAPTPEAVADPAPTDTLAAAIAAVDGLEDDDTAPAPTESAAVATPEPAETSDQGRQKPGFFQRLFGKRRPAEPEPLPAAATLDADASAPIATSAAPASVAATSLDTPAQPRASSAPLPSGGIDRAYVQIGIFSVEQNARNTATSLSNAGVLPRVIEQQSRGRTYWRVVVGPATTASDRAAVLRKAKSLGFTDAYAVSG